MIIDLILDRKDGIEYNAHNFYNDCVAYGEVGHGITYAMDYGSEEDVKAALKQYLVDNDYNLEIGKYIDSVEWLTNGDALIHGVLQLEKMKNNEITDECIQKKVDEIFGSIDTESIIKNALEEHIRLLMKEG